MISGYYDDFTPVKNLMHIIRSEIKIFGFTVGTLHPKYAKEFYEVVPKLIKDGKIKYNEEVTHGLEHASQVLADSQRGRNVGKPIVQVAEE